MKHERTVFSFRSGFTRANGALVPPTVTRPKESTLRDVEKYLTFDIPDHQLRELANHGLSTMRAMATDAMQMRATGTISREAPGTDLVPVTRPLPDEAADIAHQLSALVAVMQAASDRVTALSMRLAELKSALS